MHNLMKKLNPESILSVVTSASAETVEIYLYQNDQDQRPEFLVMSGDLSELDKLIWLAEQAAKGAGIAYQMQELD